MTELGLHEPGASIPEKEAESHFLPGFRLQGPRTAEKDSRPFAAACSTGFRLSWGREAAHPTSSSPPEFLHDTLLRLMAG